MSKAKRRLIQLALCIVFIGLGFVGLRVLMASKSDIEKRKPPAPVPMVRTIAVKMEPTNMRVQGEGTVKPLREIDLVPQVGGKVVHVSPSMVNGGVFQAGDTLLRIDPIDYELAVILAQAKVKDAESSLEMSKEEAAAAKEEWRLLYEDNDKTDKEPSPLVAKEPQLAAASARLEAQRAELRKAMLNLERTELKAPFDGRVGEEHVDVGQYVTPGLSLGVLYSTEAAEIVVPLEGETLFWLDVPDFTSSEEIGSAATVRANLAGRELSWSGEVVRTEGRLDERTRMIHVVVEVDEPYAKSPPLVFGLFVHVDIEGRNLPKAATIPRAALHEGDLVWVLDQEDRVRFRKVDVARTQGDETIVKDGLKDGERVVITPLKAVTDGMKVRVVQG